MKISPLKPLANPDEEATRTAIVVALESDPEFYLAEYTRRFGNVLNADSAATLFDLYNADPAKYRVAVHPAAQWIRDELFARALKMPGVPGRNRIAFTAGGNAAGKTTAIRFTKASEESLAVFDSTLSNSTHAYSLIHRALQAGKAIFVLHVDRPLDDALHGMIERADVEGRVVTIEQLIRSQQGAAITVQELWRDFHADPRFQFGFIRNSAAGASVATGIEAAVPQDYTENRRTLDEILNTARQTGRITEVNYQRIRGPHGK